MVVTLTVLEAFDIAGQIERNGARFYRRAAGIVDDASAGQTLLKLAEWEVEHEKQFAGMKDRISQSDFISAGAGGGETLPDPKAMAGLAVFGLRADPAFEIARGASVEEIVRKAVEMEKDSIVFYEGLKDFVSVGAGREKIDDIIQEEMRHIGILYESLKEA